MVPCFPLLGLTPSGLFMGLSSTIIYTSELILCSTIKHHQFISKLGSTLYILRDYAKMVLLRDHGAWAGISDLAFFILHLAFFISHLAFLYLAFLSFIKHLAFFISHLVFLSRILHFYRAFTPRMFFFSNVPYRLPYL